MCYDLETQYGLKPLRMINVNEKVVMFFYIITLSASNKKIQERSQNLGKTISRYSNKVLKMIFCS